MRLSHEIFPSDQVSLAPRQLAELLRPAIWLIDAGTHPPPEHEPGLLLQGIAAKAAFAVTLRTSTLMNLALGQALIDRLSLEGCALEEVAAVALHELLVNAAIHGNLCVHSGEAATWCDLKARQREIDSARSDPALAARVVTVAVGWNPECAAAVIADQGAGYRPDKPPSPVASRRAAGRGLQIARTAGQLAVLRGGTQARLIMQRLDGVSP